ncbi:MAG TPA: protein-L-isoaspartate O-methyltransferase [Devosia sp.]|nr:protein-L-isoaspartate O-methyltransferase [Devosia sp.]
MIDYAHARKTMVDNQLRTSSVTDRRVLAAMGEVPRELFVPAARRLLAYIDEAHPLEGAPGRYLGAPAPFARLVQLAEIDHTDDVLDVGCGNGYSAAVLSRLAARVVAVEPDSNLAAKARATLKDLGAANVEVIEGALADGAPAKGPYDVIVIEGGISAVPEALFGQLKPEGVLVALVAEGGRPPVAHVFAQSGRGIAARAEFDGKLPPLATAPPTDEFVF